MTPFAKMSVKALVLNACCALLVASAAVAQLRHMIVADVVPPCSTGYKNFTTVQVERNGALLSAADLQAASDGTDLGIMESMSIQRLADTAPSGTGLVVDLRNGSTFPSSPTAPGGVSFAWAGRQIPKNVSAACVGYHVYIPADFDFSTGGTFPGLYAVSGDSIVRDEDQVKAHVAWLENGAVRAQAGGQAGAKKYVIPTTGGQNARLTRGRWVRIEQELVLNDPKASDGRLRLWIDGQFANEAKALRLREAADIRIAGIMTDVYFGGPVTVGRSTVGAARKDETLVFTPIEMHWN